MELCLAYTLSNSPLVWHIALALTLNKHDTWSRALPCLINSLMLERLCHPCVRLHARARATSPLKTLHCGDEGQGVGSAEDIDKGMKLGTAHKMGPLHLADFIGAPLLASEARLCGRRMMHLSAQARSTLSALPLAHLPMHSAARLRNCTNGTRCVLGLATARRACDRARQAEA